MENPTLPTNWLAALSNARSDLGTLAYARTTTARHSRFLRPFRSKRLLRRRADDAVGNFETENQVFLQKAQAVQPE